MKIYTKTGDKGQTSLFGGTRVPKYHLRIEAYGTIDELNSYIGLVRDNMPKENDIKTLIKIQNTLFSIGALLATPENKKILKSGKKRLNIEGVTTEHILFLEKKIDRMDEKLPKMTNFVLPGGHSTVSFCHIARTVCRRAERIVTQLSDNEYVEKEVLMYLNRLSDFLFTLARKLSYDLNIEEIPWISEKLK